MQLDKVIMAAAGSGKTYNICRWAKQNQKDNNKKILIVTYTNKGVEAINIEYKKQNQGIVDKNIVIQSWYQFLLAELIKPYQSCIIDETNYIEGIDFRNMYGKVNYKRIGTKERYLSGRNVKANVVSEMALQINIKSNGRVIRRLEKIFSHIYIDEVQDMTGYDFEIFEMLLESTIITTLVGDYKQATFCTHNSTKHKKIAGTCIIDYFSELDKKGKIKLEMQNCSRRFNANICNFSNLVFPIGEDLSTSMSETTEHDGVFLINKVDIHKYISYFDPLILKYDIKTDVSNYSSLNFGQCKGLTFDRVLIFPNGPYKDFLRKSKELKSPTKYYVAATRAKYSLAFVVDRLYETKQFKFDTVSINGEILSTSKFTTN